MIGLLACVTSEWTREAALAPALARLDHDRDGRVTQAEYEPASFTGPTFAKLDANGNGAMDLAELDAMLLAADPGTFYTPFKPDDTKKKKGSSGARPGEGSPVGKGAREFGGEQPGPPGSQPRRTWDEVFTMRVFETLVEEVVSVDATLAVPSHEDLRAAAEGGDLESPPVKAILARLQAAHEVAGLQFPRSLSQ